MELLNKLQWRYATKAMDPTRPVAQDKVDRIIEAARLAPTSSGLQPYEILVVKNPALRAQIREVAWNQAQVTDASHLLVFAAWDDYTSFAAPPWAPVTWYSTRGWSRSVRSTTATPALPAAT